MSRLPSKFKASSWLQTRLRLLNLEDRNAPSDLFFSLLNPGSDLASVSDDLGSPATGSRYSSRESAVGVNSPSDLFDLLNAVSRDLATANATRTISTTPDTFRGTDTASPILAPLNFDGGTWLGYAQDNSPPAASPVAANPLPSPSAGGGNAAADCDGGSSEGNGSDGGSGTGTITSSVVPAVVSGYSPTQMRHAYGFDKLPAGSDGTGVTIAIVDAYNAATITSDVATFSTQFGLTQFNTAGGPTFKVANQTGGTSLPANNSGWAEEIDLDVEWAHAIAPKANILLVEAKSSSFSDLLTAVDYAARNSKVVSMSWSGGESSAEKTYDAHFKVPGVSFVASAGDSGTGAGYPSASPYVISVGGTNLKLDSSGNRTSETVWSSGGGGVSTVESEPGYQTAFGITSTKGKRGTPDVSYNADPNTGVPVYTGASGWLQIGGTSAGAPQMAALIAIVDQGRIAVGKVSISTASTTASPFYAAAATSAYSANYYDITSGNNGRTTATAAHAGYDLSTGLGTPVANNIVPWLIAY